MRKVRCLILFPTCNFTFEAFSGDCGRDQCMLSNPVLSYASSLQKSLDKDTVKISKFY